MEIVAGVDEDVRIDLGSARVVRPEIQRQCRISCRIRCGCCDLRCVQHELDRLGWLRVPHQHRLRRCYADPDRHIQRGRCHEQPQWFRHPCSLED
jgi:hypothetical protein